MHSRATRYKHSLFFMGITFLMCLGRGRLRFIFNHRLIFNMCNAHIGSLSILVWKGLACGPGLGGSIPFFPSFSVVIQTVKQARSLESEVDTITF